ncbi:MAG: DNA helicase RecQ [Bacteroidetes bacterium]|nr:DNA helicase RecQ [Bacteroidota bacterium]
MNLQLAAKALKKAFGYDDFRPLQAEIIQAVFQQHDVLVLMPTGGGKSICYQIPAITLDGIAVVVSPLIALMKDQVEGLNANGIPAAFLNSAQSIAQSREVEEALINGYLKLLYVSPEKLVSQGFQPLLKRLKISLFAIDEAHCISSWGHDFRPEYTQLRFLKQQFPQVPLMALTATADRLTRKDILDQLGIEQAEQFVASFDRPNISLEVRPGQRRIEQIIAYIKERPGQSGIIYCLARKTCETIAEKLNAAGFQASYYHAELSPARRNQVQEDFINDRIPIVCATIAFGMGIDKSNVRFVIHYNLPRNVEGYYQELGRAGRDGLPAEALLFFSYADVQTYRDMIEQSESSDEQKALRVAKLNRMFQVAEAPVCRRRTILNYFNEPFDRNCGNCDVCRRPPRHFDGTMAVQKALSALLRTGERAGMQLLVDVLRGSRRRDILENGFHEIKTYGAGKEYSFEEWTFLLSQMLHQGYLEIAYDSHSHLRVTEIGKAVLFEGKKVQLALPAEQEPNSSRGRSPRNIPDANPPGHDAQLFDQLVAMRRQLAQNLGVPPYIIFSDATLKGMAEKLPLSEIELLRISGVGERKLQEYGAAFLQLIQRYVSESGIQTPIPAPPVKDVASEKAPAYQTSVQLFLEGFSIHEIAEQRGLAPDTIQGHLLKAYQAGAEFPILELVRAETLDLIIGALPLFPKPRKLKPIYEHFEGRFTYDEIRWALAIAERNGAG